MFGLISVGSPDGVTILSAPGAPENKLSMSRSICCTDVWLSVIMFGFYVISTVKIY
jgi:predicted secreted protein